MDIGKKIKLLREKRGLSQQKLADLINEGSESNLKRNSISDYESGKSQPRKGTIKRIVEIFDITADYLFSDVEDTDIPTQDIKLKTLNESESTYSNSNQLLFDMIKRVEAMRSDLAHDHGEMSPDQIRVIAMEALNISEELAKKVMDLYEKNLKAIDFINNKFKG